MKVVITDIKEDQLVAEAELKAITEHILALPVDSTDEASLEAADAVAEHFGNLHVLFNNAGIGGGDKILNTPDEKWRNVYEVNVYGPLNGIKQFLPRMLAHGEVLILSTLLRSAASRDTAISLPTERANLPSWACRIPAQ